MREKSLSLPLTTPRTFVTMRRIEENIPHPEQWREWPDEAAATMAMCANGANSYRRSAYEMRAAEITASHISAGGFSYGIWRGSYELGEVLHEENAFYVRVRHRRTSG